MQNDQYNLGELRGVYRPSSGSLWLILMLSIPLLMLAALCLLLILDSLTGVVTGNKREPFNKVSGYFVCLGVVGLLLALFGSLFVEDFRKWSATRSVELRIYDNGLTYESTGHREVCRWEEIKDINFRSIKVRTKAFPMGLRIKVIRSIEKRDGAVITLAETLKLGRITDLITTAIKAR